MAEGPGTLYVVGTPIGNLGDLGKRAEETLSIVDAVVAEDTRRTRALLSHLGIGRKPVVSLDANATERAVTDLAERLAGGETLALVTDAGTPGVSDPGAKLVRAASLRGVPITSVPGPSAVTAAVAVSGLVDGPFLFLGFLPRKGTKRAGMVAKIRASEFPVVLFEAPGRADDTLRDLAQVMPDREACVARELTKVHEEVRRGTLAELAKAGITARGEFTIVVSRGADADGNAEEGPPDSDVDALIAERLEAGDSPRTVATDVAARWNKPRREIYARVLEAARRRGG
ncbi:MAG TPA: 16S rRNA (cytidine(1402)-2'-O)-methyltransferase [Polyangiaceae bacterium]|nr:16S rRNA (cytidine(1402)-2'-O)-methyltransferase [Polyangiaceae bacterium]